MSSTAELAVAIVLGLGWEEKESGAVLREGSESLATFGCKAKERWAPVYPRYKFLEGAGAREDFQRFDCGVRRQKNGSHYSSRNGFRGYHFSARSLGPEGFPDVGVGGAGKQADDADAARAQLLAKSIGEAEGGMFGGVIRSRPGEYASSSD